MKRPTFTRKPLALNVAVLSTLLTIPALVQTVQAADNQYQFDIAKGSLGSALTQIGEASGSKLLVPSELTNGLTTQGVSGRYTLKQALQLVLKGTGLGFSVGGDSASKTIHVTKVTDEVATLDTVHVDAAPETARFGDAPAESGGFKAEYQTTATKMALSLKETPQAISVVTRESLESRQVKDLSTALELTAGISNSSNNAGSQTGPGLFAGRGQYDHKFVLRGQPVDVRSDGFSIGNDNIDMSAYERIEVVKGPSGFYGQGSLGGFINAVRKKPQKAFAASISGSAGSYNNYRTELDVTGALNEAKNLRGRVTFAYENAEAFVDDIENERVMIAPSFEAIISDRTRVLAQVLYQKDRYDANPGIPLELVGDEMKPYDNLSSRTELYGATGDKSETETLELMVRVDHELSDRWLASLLLQGNKATRDIVEGNGASVYFGALYVGGLKDLWERDYWAGELRLEGKFDAFGQEHQLLIGVEENRKDAKRDYGYAYTNIGLPTTFTGDFSNYQFRSVEDIPTTITRDRTIENTAYYAQTVLTLHEKTKLLIGGRYDKSDEHLVGINAGAPYEDGPRDESAFTSRIGLTHAFNDNVSAYAIYAESFKPTGLSGRSGILDPITGDGYELGLKTDWFNNKLGATLAVYRQELDNRPITDPASLTDALPGTYSMSAGLHRTEGVELEITGSPYPGLTIAAAASWMDNEFTDSDDPNEGLKIDGSVDNQFSLYANYELQGGPLRGLGIGGSFVKVGDRQFIIGGAQTFVKGYERVDAHISYKGLPNWDMSLLIRNVTDEKYIESATAALGSGTYFGSPRAALFQAKYHF